MTLAPTQRVSTDCGEVMILYRVAFLHKR